MGGDDSRLFRADENSQTGTSFPEAGTSYPESGTSLQRLVLHRVTHVTCAAIGKEDSGGISYCEHSLSSCLSSLLVLCVGRLARASESEPASEVVLCVVLMVRASKLDGLEEWPEEPLLLPEVPCRQNYDYGEQKQPRVDGPVHHSCEEQYHDRNRGQDLVSGQFGPDSR
jgi:hypothetical protein